VVTTLLINNNLVVAMTGTEEAETEVEATEMEMDTEMAAAEAVVMATTHSWTLATHVLLMPEIADHVPLRHHLPASSFAEDHVTDFHWPYTNSPDFSSMSAMF